jgi:hypothetical protein
MKGLAIHCKKLTFSNQINRANPEGQNKNAGKVYRGLKLSNPAETKVEAGMTL